MDETIATPLTGAVEGDSRADNGQVGCSTAGWCKQATGANSPADSLPGSTSGDSNATLPVRSLAPSAQGRGADGQGT
eukprot:5883924-Alexandrium_andersonii.AAC.1